MDEIILIDKPAGMSSFSVVARVRRKLSEAMPMMTIVGKDGVTRQKRQRLKVGHTGTLDPFATGLLIVLAGKATKRANEFLKLDKEYIATVRLGEVSTTGDVEGEITPYNPVVKPNAGSGLATPVFTGSLPLSSRQRPAKFPVLGLTTVRQVVQSFVGEIEQQVPNYSAVKINGERAYKLARAGKMVEMPRRKVKVYEIEILDYSWPDLTIRCKVSSGTYIRTLGEDIGKKLGVGGYLTALRRTQVGDWRIENAKTLEEFGAE